MMILRNNDIDKANEFVTPEGNQYEVIYSPKVLPDGTIELIESGRRDLREEINSWAEQTDMAFILRQMAIGQFEGRENLMYGDFTETPKNMAEAMQIMIDAERAFYQLPLDTRNRFDNDYKRWLVMASGDTEKFADLMGFKNETAEPAEPAGKENLE